MQREDLSTLTERQLAHDIRAGKISPADAERALHSLSKSAFANSTWQVVQVANGFDPIPQFVAAVVNEAIGMHQEAPMFDRSLLASATSDAYLALDQVAMAEQALLRARDFASKVTDPKKRDGLTRFLAINTYAIAKRSDQYDVATKTFSELNPPGDERNDLIAVAAQLTYEITAATLEYRNGRLAHSIYRFLECLPLVRAVEASRGMTSEEATLVREFQNQLSRFFSNFSVALSMSADSVEAHPTINELTIALRKALDADIVMHAFWRRWFHSVAKALRNTRSQWVEPRTARELALKLNKHATVIATAIDSTEFLAIQHFNAGRLLEQLGNRKEAVVRAEVAALFAAKHPGHQMTTEIREFLARNSMRHRDGKAALEHWRVGVTNEVRRVIEYGGARDTNREDTIINAVFSTTLEGADHAQAILLVEGLLGLTMAVSLQRGIPSVEAADGSELVVRRDTLLKQREELRVRNQNGIVDAELRTVEGDLQEVRRALALQSPTLGSWTAMRGIEPLGPTEAFETLKHLGPQTLLIGTAGHSGGELWLYVIGQGKCAVKLVSRPRRSSLKVDLEEFPKALLVPISDMLDNLTPNDTIVFTGPPEIPFSGLSFRGRPLCQTARVLHIQSLRVLQAVAERPTIAYECPLVVGNPRRSDVPDLPGASDEVREVCNLFGASAPPLVEEKATTTAVLQRSNADVFHFACHASNDGRWSSLLLAPSTGDSGNLSEDRILHEMRLRQGAFVNLAACRSARQSRRSGFVDGGLVNAFLAVGARNVLATVSPIEDESARRFQIEFYKRLRQRPSPAEALVETQRACIAGDLEHAMQHPRVWTAFVLFGAS